MHLESLQPVVQVVADVVVDHVEASLVFGLHHVLLLLGQLVLNWRVFATITAASQLDWLALNDLVALIIVFQVGIGLLLIGILRSFLARHWLTLVIVRLALRRQLLWRDLTPVRVLVKTRLCGVLIRIWGQSETVVAVLCHLFLNLNYLCPDYAKNDLGVLGFWGFGVLGLFVIGVMWANK